MDSKKLFVFLGAVGLTFNVLVTSANAPLSTKEELPESKPPVVEQIEPVKPSVNIEDVVVEEPIVETTTYRVTAYCSCEKCCGKWANNRELDENGNPIVLGAWGKELVSNFSCASPMAFGTQIELEGIGTVEVQDRTAKWIVEKYGENIIDLYMDDHDAALEFGVKYLEGVIK